MIVIEQVVTGKSLIAETSRDWTGINVPDKPGCMVLFLGAMSTAVVGQDPGITGTPTLTGGTYGSIAAWLGPWNVDGSLTYYRCSLLGFHFYNVSAGSGKTLHADFVDNLKITAAVLVLSGVAPRTGANAAGQVRDRTTSTTGTVSGITAVPGFRGDLMIDAVSSVNGSAPGGLGADQSSQATDVLSGGLDTINFGVSAKWAAAVSESLSWSTNIGATAAHIGASIIPNPTGSFMPFFT